MNMYAFAWIQLQMLVSCANKRTGRLVGDRGEGVISTAIAVLITAFLGVAMWLGFNEIWGETQDGIKDQMDLIGQ